MRYHQISTWVDHCHVLLQNTKFSCWQNVLKSERAITMSIRIIEIFVKLRETLLMHKDVLLKLEQLEKIAVRHDGDIKLIFKYLRELLNPKTEPMRKGFKRKDEKD